MAQNQMRITMDLPEIPRWATDGGATLEPSEAKKDEGWVVGKRPPARWQNWWQNSVYQYLQRVTAAKFSSAMILPPHGSALNLRAGIYHPAVGRWVVQGGTTGLYYTYSGYPFNSAGGTAPALATGACAIDTTRYVMKDNTATSVQYSTTGTGSWTSVATGITGQVNCIYTKYPDGDFIVVGGGTGSIRYASSVSGSYSSPTLGTGSLSTITDVVRVGSTSWLCIDTIGDTFYSSDDADNWGNTTNSPNSQIATWSTAYSLGVNYTDGVVVAVGDTSANDGLIAYSTDYGDTWTQATLHDTPTEGGAEVGTFRSVYYCGGQIWVAAGDIVTSNQSPNIMVSMDNGVNWYAAEFYNENNDSKDNILWIAGNGRNLFFLGDSGFNAVSLMIPGV